MRAAKLYGPEDIRVTDEDEPTLNTGTVRVDLRCTGVCGSDVHEYKIGPVPIRAEDKDHRIPESEWGELLPKPMGHEMAGTVSEVGEGVENIEVGDQVALDPLLSCGECQYCEAGQPQLCTMFDGEVVNTLGFAESIVVPAAAAVPVPDGLPLRYAALGEPLSVSVHALRRSGLQLGDEIAVFGAGPIGLGIVDAAEAAGAGRILVSEPRQARRDIARTLGADVVVDPEESAPIERFKRETDGGVDIGFEVAGVSETLTQTLRSTQYGGTVVIVSVFETEATMHPNDIMQAERNVVGSFAYDDEFEMTLQMMADGRLTPDAFVTDEVSLEDIDAAFRQLTESESEQVKILIEP